MEEEKWLDENFEGTEKVSDVCYIIRKDEVELCAPYDTVYPVITKEEILKLAEIVKEDKSER